MRTTAGNGGRQMRPAGNGGWQMQQTGKNGGSRVAGGSLFE